MDAPTSRRAPGRVLRRALVLAGALAVALPGHGHVQPLTDQGAAYHWDAADLPLAFVINAAGSDDVPDTNDDFAVRQGFGQWEDVTYADFTFAEDSDPLSRARTDWEADDIHLVLFDEDDSSGLFPAGSGLLAVTVLEVDEASGAIQDGDVLFNGGEFDFTTDPSTGDFDIWSLAAHEAGHLVGLGHSPIGAATMAPFLQGGEVTARSLAPDESMGLERLYPVGVRAEVRGTITRSGGAAVSGAHVWILGQSNGRVAGSTLTASDGSYSLPGLDPGAYVVFTGPLDGTLTPDDLSNPGQPFLDTFFQPAQSGGFSIVGVELITDVDIEVGADSALTILAPHTPLTLARGGSETFELEVTGFSEPGDVIVPFSGQVTVSGFSVDGTTIEVTVAATQAAPSGQYDLQVTSALGTRATLTGFVDVVPPPPQLAGSAPDCGGNLAGPTVTLTGSGFGDDPTVLFGDAFGTVTFVGPGGGVATVEPPTGMGTGPVDVVLLTVDAQEARVADGYTLVDGGQPLVDTLFPPAGTDAGGTELTILGSGFGPDLQVFFDNDEAASVTLVSETQLTVVTPALAAGDYDVSLLYVDCLSDPSMFAILDDAFTSVAGDDPTITDVAPATVGQGGSELITVTGTGFVPGAQVEMFNDPLTGAGGSVLATGFVSANLLTATTPAGPLPGGLANVLVRLPSGQAGLLEDAVEVDAPEIFEVVPASVPRTGGDTITLTGFGFDATASVELFTDLDDFTGGTPLATTFIDSGTLEAVTPAGPLPAGPANVAVQMQGGSIVAGLEGGLLLADPTVDDVSPDELLASGGETITVTGTGFEPGTVVQLDGVDLATSFVDPGTLTADTGAGPLPVGLADVSVQVLGGALSATLVDAVDILPELAEVTPASVPDSGFDVLTVNGVGFEAGTSVEVFNNLIDFGNGTPLPTTVIDNGTLEATLVEGPLPLGAANLVVRVPGAQPVAIEGAFEVLASRIDDVEPDQLAVVGGETITVTGFGFRDDAVVELFNDPADFSGGTPLDTTFVDGGTLTAVTPAGPLELGQATVVVRFPGTPGFAIGLEDAVEIAEHTVQAVEPGLISHIGGEEIRVLGSFFEAGAVVEFFTDPETRTGGLALSTTFVSDTELLAVTPADVLVPGFVNVAVRNPGDSVVVLEDGIEVATILESTNSGDGDLGDEDDSDTIMFDGLEGSVIAGVVKRLGKGSTVEPTLTLFAEDGTRLLSSDPDDPTYDPTFVKANVKVAALVKYTLPETGRYAMRIGRLSGEGAYRYVFKEKPSKFTIKQAFGKKNPGSVGPGQDFVVEIDGKADSICVIKFVGGKGSGVNMLLTVTAPDGTVLVQTDAAGVATSPAGLQEWVDRTFVVKDGLVVVVKKPSVPQFGTYTVTISSADGTAADVFGAVVLKPIRKKAFFESL